MKIFSVVRCYYNKQTVNDRTVFDKTTYVIKLKRFLNM